MFHSCETSLGKVNFNAYCTHPKLVNNDTVNIGCNAQCEDCKYCKAEMQAKDLLELIHKLQEVEV